MTPVNEHSNRLMNPVARLLAIGAMVCALSAAGQGVRYRDSVFSEISYTMGVHYSSAPSVKGFEAYLTLDLYEPVDDTAPSRPLVMLMHAGGFMSGAAHDYTLRSLCFALARRGYVCASINYRVGVPDTTSSLDYVKAIYRVVEDARAAARYVVAQQDLRIDPERVIVGGNSAGAVAALHYACMDDSAMAARIGDTAGIGDTGTAGPTPGAAAVLNMWGGLLDPSWIQPGGPPIISFHGTADTVVPFRCGRALGVPDLTMCGSGAIDSLARARATPTELHTLDTGHVEFPVEYMAPLMAHFLYRLVMGGSGVVARPPLQGSARLRGPHAVLYMTERALPPGYRTDLRGRSTRAGAPGVGFDIR